MTKDPILEAPDEARLESMLSNFHPEPTDRFYRKIRSAPWENQPKVSDHWLLRFIKPTKRLAISMAVLLFFMMVIGFSLFPSVRAIARQLFYSFIQAPTNQLEIQVTSSKPADFENFSNPSNFPLSISAARQLAGFNIKSIEQAPDGLILIGAKYDPSYRAVIILYKGDGYMLFVTQRQLGNGSDVFSVGASAQVEPVDIGDAQGEFVAGGWKAVSIQTTVIPSGQPTQTHISATWDPNEPQYTLRWIMGCIVYEIRAMGDGSPTKAQLITLANGLK